MPLGWLTIFRCSEPYAPLVKGICAASNPLRPQHHFRHVEGIHETPVQRDWKKEHPLEKKASKKDRELHHILHAQHVSEKADDIYKKGKVSSLCSLHPRGSCQVRWEPPEDGDERSSPLRMAAAGPFCQGWCKGGGQEGIAHKGTLTWNYWGQEQKKFDINFVEEAREMPTHVWSRHVKGSHRVVFTRFCSSNLGHPTQRFRFRGAAMAFETVVWTGPKEEEDVTDDFLKFYMREVMLEANVYQGLDTVANSQKNLQAYAKRHKVELTGDELFDLSLVPVLADGYVSNLVGYHKIAPQFVGPLHGGYAVDLSQNYDQRPRAGAWLPSLRISTQLAVLDLQDPSRDSLLTAKELAFSQGYPEFPWLASEGLAACKGVPIDSLELAAQQRVHGNGMHLAAEQAWYLYVLSRCVRRDVLELMPPPLLPRPASSSVFAQEPYREEEESCVMLS